MFEEIYESMMGFREESAKLPWIPSAFEEGEHCMREYEQMREAYLRICERLGAGDEDEDLDIIVDCFESIQKELCERMFDHGIQFVSDKHYFDSYYQQIGKEPRWLKKKRTGTIQKADG